jgi:uncharacterized protein (TIGR00369 family)
VTIDIAALAAALNDVLAPWVRRLGLEVREAGDGEVLLHLPVTAEHVHAGGVLCGQTLMAAADTSMIVAVMTKLGSFKPMTTVQMQTSFLRPVPKDASHVVVRARVLRMGRTVVFGEVHLLGPSEAPARPKPLTAPPGGSERSERGGPDLALVAQATTTYALL